MRIAFLNKRQYMRKDVIDDRYGRLFALPAALAAQGHDVLDICLSYRTSTEGHLLEEEHLCYSAYALRGNVWPRLSALGDAYRELQAFQPEVVIGCSDALHVVLAGFLAHRLGIPYAVDLYDNFESFGLSRLPGLTALYRRALRGAVLVSCVSIPLRDYVQQRYRPQRPTLALESTIDSDLFYPRSRPASRAAFGLPLHAKLIGTAGALDYNRGIKSLYQAWQRLSTNQTDVHLVLAGKADQVSPLPRGGRVHYLGELPHNDIPNFWSALDVAVICVRDTPFGRYSFPQKAYEILACETPVVAAAVGAMRELCASCQTCSYRPDDAEDLAGKILSQLVSPQRPTHPVPTWHNEAQKLAAALASSLGTRIK